jgi:hypothetical protein
VLVRAAVLCRIHPLRAYDAAQLACALTQRDDDEAAGRPVSTFVCADEHGTIPHDFSDTRDEW